MTTILYVDDNATNRRLVERLVQLRDHLMFLEAATGTEGLELARRERPGLILLDLRLPDLQGDQILAQLKGDPATRSIPIVIVTAEAHVELHRPLLDAGALDCLVKPINVGLFLALLDEVVPP